MKAIILIINSRLKNRKLINCLLIMLIAISICILNVALSLSNGFETGIINKLLSISPQITVFTNKNPVLNDFKKKVDKQVEITQIQALALNQLNQAMQGVILKGANSESLKDLLSDKYLINGKYPVDNEVLLGEKLAEYMDVGIGDTVNILTDPASILSFKVSGIYKIGLFEYDNSVIICTNSSIQNLAEDSMFSRISSYYGLWLKNPLESKILAQKVSEFNPGINILNWQDENKVLFDAISLEKKIIFIVLFLLILGSIFSIAITQMLTIISQKTQIAVLTAIGFTPSRLMTLYVLEIFIITLIGIVFGAILTFISVWYLTNSSLDLPINVYHIENLPVNFKIMDFAIISFFTAFFSILFGIIPAIYAFRLNPVEILRN